MENDTPSQEYIGLQIDLNEAIKKYESSAKQFQAQVKSETNFLSDSTRVILGSSGVSRQDKDRAVEALKSFVEVDSLMSRALQTFSEDFPLWDEVMPIMSWFQEMRPKLKTSLKTHQEILSRIKQLVTLPVRCTLLSPAELITDHAEDPDLISSQGIKYYMDRLNNYPATIREMDKLMVAIGIQINNIAECKARMRQLEAAGLQLDPTAAVRLRDERVAMLLRAR